MEKSGTFYEFDDFCHCWDWRTAQRYVLGLVCGIISNRSIRIVQTWISCRKHWFALQRYLHCRQRVLEALSVSSAECRILIKQRESNKSFVFDYCGNLGNCFIIKRCYCFAEVRKKEKKAKNQEKNLECWLHCSEMAFEAFVLLNRHQEMVWVTNILL